MDYSYVSGIRVFSFVCFVIGSLEMRIGIKMLIFTIQFVLFIAVAIVLVTAD